MGIKMDLGASESQASAVAKTSAQRVAAYQAEIDALTAFVNEQGLKGKAYRSAQNYAQQLFIPSLQAAILYEEGRDSSTSKVPSRYTTDVGSENLDQDILEKQIRVYNEVIDMQNAALELKMADKVLNKSTISSIQSSIGETTRIRDELQEKLNKLIAFDATSASLFSEIPSLESAVEQALAQMEETFIHFNGSFTLPAAEKLAWTKTIAKAWKEREKRIKKAKTEQTASKKAKQVHKKASRMKKGKGSTHADTIAQKRAQTVSDKQASKEFKQNLKEQYGFDDRTASIMWKLYRNIKKKEGDNADYVFNRLMGGIVYDDSKWKMTAGTGAFDSTGVERTIKEQLKIFGLNKKDCEILIKQVEKQHKETGNNADFAHQSITTATHLYPNILRAANGYGVIKGKGWNHNYVNELSGWRGDTTLGNPPVFNTPDYKSDLDAVNITNRMQKNKIDYATANNQYYADLKSEKTTRASEFTKNIGGINHVKSELYKTAGISTKDDKQAMEELKAKNQTAYNFIISLQKDSDEFIE